MTSKITVNTRITIDLTIPFRYSTMYIISIREWTECHIERAWCQEKNQIEWRDKFDTHFEWKYFHSIHSPRAEHGPTFITFVLTHLGRVRAELPLWECSRATFIREFLITHEFAENPLKIGQKTLSNLAGTPLWKFK